MIRVNIPAEPPTVLKVNGLKWKQDLLKSITIYGGYSKIPEKEKKQLLKHYRHSDIKSVLFSSTNNKCAFCECVASEGGNIEVEHFAPKSLYPDLTFEWNNFLPVCRKCNEAKGDFDTVLNRIVNPSKENPDDYFKFNILKIVATTDPTRKDIADLSIETCRLNDSWLMKARADMLYNLSVYESSLGEWIEEYKLASTKRTRKNRITKLRNSLDTINSLSHRREKYSAFCESFLSQSATYQEAKRLVEQFHE